jgi:dihydropyrimidine dehydrogenase (NAD+) subunit PreA
MAKKLGLTVLGAGPAGDRVPVIDESECVGCNLCKIVCPVPDCISMVEVDNGFAPTTWNEHVSQGKDLRPKKGAH